MPKLKVDHVVSFSSEDPVHVANNILSSDTAKKWKCKTAGEKSASVVLQLEKASVISAIDIGNEHSAFVEVLVKRSSSEGDFKALLVLSSFMSPLEARQSINLNKVRMFSYEDFQTPVRDEKWDRVKIVCMQPFNRHVQYGLSFVTLHSLEGKEPQAATQTKLGNFTLRPESPVNLSTGSLFARRKELVNEAPPTVAAAIRQATVLSLAGKTTPTPSKNKLKAVTAAASSTKYEPPKNTITDTPTFRNRNELLYCKDDEGFNEKIDRLVEQKIKEGREKQLLKQEKSDEEKKTKPDKAPSSSGLHSKNNSSAGSNKRKSSNKDMPSKKRKAVQTRPFSELFSGVTLVISGIQNPDRSDIRAKALSMGAKYKADWDNTCTHLICAFSNTPKFNQVKGKGKIVNRYWILDGYSQRKRLPWRRYALDKQDQNKVESEEEILENKVDAPVSNSDTEDEIDRIEALQGTKNA